MVKNKLYILLAILVSIIFFATAAICNQCTAVSGEEEKQEEPEEEAVIETVEEIIAEEEKFYKNVELHFEDKENNRFPSNWYERDGLETIPLSDYKIRFTEESVLTGLKKYPDGVLEQYLKSVCAFDDITVIEGGGRVSLGGGTNSHITSAAYLINKGAENGILLREGLENILHAEISSILYKHNTNLFNEEAWRAINPEDFEYFGEGKSIIYTNKDEFFTMFDPSIYDLGFPNSYATTNIENDFNAFALLLFTNHGIWNQFGNYNKLKQKLDLTRDFYLLVDKDFEPFIRSQYEKYGIDWTLD